MLGRLGFLSLSVLLASSGALAQAARVSTVEGSATATPKGHGPALLLKAGARVQAGDVIETQEGARLELLLDTGSVVRLAEKTKVTVDALGSGGGGFRARLLLGNLWAKVSHLLATQRFEVETENAVAGVRGTEFTVGRGADGGLVRVFEGTVEVKDPKGGWEHQLGEGRELSFRRGARPGPPRTFDLALANGDPLLKWAKQKPVKRVEPPKPEKPERLEKPGQKDEPPPPKKEAPPPDKKAELDRPHVWESAGDKAELPSRPQADDSPATPARLGEPKEGGAEAAGSKPERPKERVHERERVNRGQRRK